MSARLWHIVPARMRSVFLRGRREADLRDELQLHIEREAEQYQSNGMSPEAARLRALRAFGGVEQIKEECRDARGTLAFEAVARDARHAIRRLVRDWRFTVAAIAILALGIGANTAMFSVINATLFRDRSFADPDRLVDIYQRAINSGGVDANSYPAYLDMANYTDVFVSTTAATVPNGVNYQDGGALRPAVVEYTTAAYLSVLGLRPSLGRWFDAAEDSAGAGIVAVVSHRTWMMRFAADPSVVGRTIRIEGMPVTIVGVGPARHNATIDLGLVTDFWLPIAAIPSLGGPPWTLARRPAEAAFLVKARLRDGVTLAQARAAMDSLGARLAREYPNEDPGKGINVIASNDVRIHPQMDVPITALASALLAVVGLVLAIACSNLATLLLVRATARAKEISIRLALGATRRQLVRYVLTESVLLAVAGGAAGSLIAWWGIRWLSSVELPIVVDFSIDYRVFAFAVALSLATGLAFGITPALKGTRVDLVPALRNDNGPRVSNWRWFTLKNALVVFQLASSVVLLSGTGVFIQMLLAARAQRTGFAVEGVAMLETDARYAGYSASDANNIYAEIRRRVETIPGVHSTALIASSPMQTDGLTLVVESERADARTIIFANSIWAGPGYFETLRIPILLGRSFDERDRADTPRVAVVNEAMARKHFGTVNALGRRFRIDQDPNWIEVVGIAADTKTADRGGDLVDPTPYLFYRSSSQWGRPSTTVIARTSRDAGSLVAAMQKELRGINVALPVIKASTMAQSLEASLAAPAAVATFLGVLGALGLILAGIGLYAVISFVVSRRSREIGIRMALGARRQQVVWEVAREVAAIIGVGTTIGLALSMAVILLIRAVSSPVPGVVVYRPGVNPFVLLSIAVFMALVGLAAAFVPARRAASLDPLIALRHE